MAPKHRLSGTYARASKRFASDQTFEHQILASSQEQVRLLRMLANDNEVSMPLDFELVTQEINQVAPFYAISYAWGPNTESVPIFINGLPFSVFKNCFIVLNQVYEHWKRGLLQYEYLWIDSVCINQDDDVEKGWQVSIMGAIYAKAATVLAYLGPHSVEEESMFLFEKAREVLHLPFNCIHAENLCLDCQKPWIDWTLSLGKRPLHRLVTACAKFGNRDYWKRVWIIQETAKATELSVLCGNDILPRKALESLEQFLALEIDELPQILKAYPPLPECDLNSMHDVFAVRRELVTLSSIISRFSKSLCKDPRDRVYGLLSLFDWPEGAAPITSDCTILPFTLAERVGRYLHLEDIRDLLLLFKVTAEDHDVEQTALPRRLKDWHPSVDPTDDIDIDFKPLLASVEDDHETLDTSICCLIVEDEERNLTAALTKCDTDDDFFSSEDCESDVEDEYFEDLTPSSVESSLSSFTEHEPQRLMLGSEVAGYICEGASKGDVLLPLPTKSSEVYLVLRPNQGGLYDILGQAILLPNFELGVSPDISEEGSTSNLFKGCAEVKLSSEDGVLLFAQDMSNSEDEFDVRGRSLRLITKVTSHPNGAVRFTSWSSLSVVEATKRLGLGGLQRLHDVDPLQMFSRLESDKWHISLSD